MRAIIDRLSVPSTWMALAAGLCLALLAGAHAFERLGGLPPCALCYLQRDILWAALAVSVLGLIGTRLIASDRWGRVIVGLLGAAFLTSATVAIYHAGAEYKLWAGPSTCSGAAFAGGTADIAQALSGDAPPPACDEAPWSMLGISMAGYNGLISLVLAGFSLAAAARERSAFSERP